MDIPADFEVTCAPEQSPVASGSPWHSPAPQINYRRVPSSQTPRPILIDYLEDVNAWLQTKSIAIVSCFVQRRYRIDSGEIRAMRPLAAILASFILAAVASGASRAQTVPDYWDERQGVAKAELEIARLRFLTTTDFFPFSFLDAQGRLSGFHLDLARAICIELDLLDRCQIQALPFDELEAALDEGEGEALIAGLSITRRTRVTLLFSRPYLRFPARFVARRSAGFAEPIYEQLAGRRIGVMADTAHEAMLRDFFPQMRPVTYSDRERLLEDVADGTIDAVFGDGMQLSFWLAGEEGRHCCAFTGGPYFAPEYLGQGLAVAVRHDLPDLVTAIDYALQEIEAKGIFAELYLRYFPVGFH